MAATFVPHGGILFAVGIRRDEIESLFPSYVFFFFLGGVLL
jgi:hypothetical protein